MNREIRLFLLVVGIPALLIAGAGMYLVHLELDRAERVAEVQKQEKLRLQQMAQHRGQMQRQREAKRPQGGAKPPGQTGAAREPGPPEGFGPNREGRRLGGRPPGRGPGWFVRAFSDLEAQRERELLIGGCVLVLLFLSLVAGAWMLAKSAKKAREEAMLKTDFLSNISHEFKTPLTTICLCAELAEDEGLSPERRRKALASIVDESARLKRLVLNALDFSRLEKCRRAFAPVACDLAALAVAAGEPLRARFPDGGLKLPEGSVPATADVAAFQQIVVILLDNAAKYAARGGPVVCGLAAVGDRIELTVADRGPGLDKKGLKHAFDRFWRGDDATTAETGGSGLGLAIAKELAKGMKGTLSVAPRDGGGLVFTLSLPAAPQ